MDNPFTYLCTTRSLREQCRAPTSLVIFSAAVVATVEAWNLMQVTTGDRRVLRIAGTLAIDWDLYFAATADAGLLDLNRRDGQPGEGMA